jgi:hypothetical protein
MSEELVGANNKLKKAHPLENLEMEAKSLNVSYKGILELANTIANTLLIKNNNWIIQVKAIHQHYLYTDENGLADVKSSAKSAIEIGARSEGKNATLTALYTITFNPKDDSFELINEKVDSKPAIVKKDGKKHLTKILSLLSK